MSKKLIVVAHGIGDTQEGFEAGWQKVMAKNVDLKGAEVKGLWWEDVLDQVEAQYPLVSNTMAELVAMCGFDDFKKWVGNDSWKTFKDYT